MATAPRTLRDMPICTSTPTTIPTIMRTPMTMTTGMRTAKTTATAMAMATMQRKPATIMRTEPVPPHIPRRLRARPGPLPAASLLQLIWLASPALPVGGFSYSEGLESAVERGLLRDEAAVGDWLLDQLHLGQARGDLAVLAGAVGAWRRGDLAQVRALNNWVLHTRESSELRLQTEQMGRSLCAWLRNQHPAEATPPPITQQIATLAQLPPSYPVAFALAAARTQAPVREILCAYAFGWAENMVQAALKSMPLGQSAGQRILARLTAAIPDAAAHAAALPDGARQAFTPMLAVLSAQHETQYSRLFRS